MEKKEIIEILGKRGFYEILKALNEDKEIIISDLYGIAGAGTVLDRRNEMLKLKLIYSKKVKIGRRRYVVYKLTPKGKKVLSLLEELIKVMKKEE